MADSTNPTDSSSSPAATTPRVTGIGGVFFKCKDPDKVKAWYKTHLGFDVSPWGTNFDWRDEADPTKTGSTAWSPFPETSKYFEPSAKEFMINYIVNDLAALVEQLKKDGVTIVDNIEDSDFGKFIHIMDIEGNKLQLWEPK